MVIVISTCLFSLGFGISSAQTHGLTHQGFNSPCSSASSSNCYRRWPQQNKYERLEFFCISRTLLEHVIGQTKPIKRMHKTPGFTPTTNNTILKNSSPETFLQCALSSPGVHSHVVDSFRDESHGSVLAVVAHRGLIRHIFLECA